MNFSKAKADTVKSLRTLQASLDTCVDEGLLDEESFHHNLLLSLVDEASLSQNWDELLEVITKAKTLEVEIISWLSFHGSTTISLPWPRKTL